MLKFQFNLLTLSNDFYSLKKNKQLTLGPVWWCMPVSSATTGEFWVQAHPELYILTYCQQNKTITNWTGKFTTVYSWHMRWEEFQGIILKWGFWSKTNPYNSLLCNFLIMSHLFIRAFSKSLLLTFFDIYI